LSQAEEWGKVQLIEHTSPWVHLTAASLSKLPTLASIAHSFCALCPVMHVRPTGLHLG